MRRMSNTCKLDEQLASQSLEALRSSSEPFSIRNALVSLAYLKRKDSISFLGFMKVHANLFWARLRCCQLFVCLTISPPSLVIIFLNSDKRKDSLVSDDLRTTLVSDFDSESQTLVIQTQIRIPTNVFDSDIECSTSLNKRCTLDRGG